MWTLAPPSCCSRSCEELSQKEMHLTDAFEDKFLLTTPIIIFGAEEMIKGSAGEVRHERRCLTLFFVWGCTKQLFTFHVFSLEARVFQGCSPGVARAKTRRPAIPPMMMTSMTSTEMHNNNKRSADARRLSPLSVIHIVGRELYLALSVREPRDDNDHTRINVSKATAAIDERERPQHR